MSSRHLQRLQRGRIEAGHQVVGIAGNRFQLRNALAADIKRAKAAIRELAGGPSAEQLRLSPDRNSLSLTAGQQ